MSQVNRNFQYLTDVDGHTIWEKLRVVRNFLLDRNKALAVAELNQRKFEAQKASMDEWELQEALILKQDEESLIQDCRDEIKFLTKLEQLLAEAAEVERIEGATDREMYELNYPNEQRARDLHKAKTEVIAFGNISTETASKMLKDPVFMNELVRLQLVDERVAENINLLPKPTGQLVVERSSNKLLGNNTLALE